MKSSRFYWVFSFLSLAALIFVVGGCSQENSSGSDSAGQAAPSASSEAASDQVYVIRAGLIDTTSELENVPSSMVLLRYFAAVEERTGGKVKFDVYPDGQLASGPDQAFAGARNGAFDLFSLSPGSWGAYTKAFAALNIPYLLLSPEIAAGFIDSGYAARMSDKARQDTQMRVLGYFDIGLRHMTNNKRPVKTPDDVKGLKLRTMPDPIQIAAMESLGASCQVVPYAELFTALQQGLVDGQENPATNISILKLYDIQKYMTLTSHSYTFTVMTISESKFQSLPKEYQDILLEEAQKAMEWCRAASRKNDVDQIEFLKTKMEVYEPTLEELKLFRDKAKASWTLVEKNIGAGELKLITDEIAGIEAGL